MPDTPGHQRPDVGGAIGPRMWGLRHPLRWAREHRKRVMAIPLAVRRRRALIFLLWVSIAFTIFIVWAGIDVWWRSLHVFDVRAAHSTAEALREQIELSSATLLAYAAAVIGGWVVVGVWWLWWRLPKRQVERLRFAIRDPKARTDVEDNFRKTTGQLLGGTAVLIGAGFAYLQFTQQQQSARDLLISNQVAKGFELLGNKEKIVSLRLGGIYALEGVMNTSAQYHQPVLEALCAFVRDETRRKADRSNLSTEIRAALEVIARRKVGSGLVNLAGAVIPKADLHGTDLGHADLSNTYLRGADLSYVFASDHADLRHANLSDADLFHANLSGAYLSEADLSDAVLSEANLSSVLLNSTNLKRAKLLSAYLGDADLSRADLSDAYLISAYLGDADLSRADLSHASLTGADLSHADLSNAVLTGAYLDAAHLNGARDLTQGQLDAACGDDKTKLDPPLTIKPCPQ